jgi:hypothetical protein
MPVTYEPIATTTLSANTSTVILSSIPGTYTDLVVVSVFGSSNGMDIFMRFNNDSGSNYSTTRIAVNSANPNTPFALGSANQTGIQPRTSVNQQTSVTTILRDNIMNYSNTTTFKSVIGRYDYPGQVESHVGTWRNTAAITRIDLVSDGQQFTTGSIFTIYGIKAA